MMEALTHTSFDNLTKTEQIVMVINSGKQLLSRKENEYTIELFLLNGLFIEVWYEVNTTKIVKVQSANKDSIIKNYKVLDEFVEKTLKNI